MVWQCSSVVERLLHMHKAQGQGGGGRGSRMAQQANALATKFNNLSFIPRTHLAESPFLNKVI